MPKTISAYKGFTLIELAVVIAIIAILAAVAIPRFSNLTAGAERAVAENFTSQLNTAAATYTAEQAKVPTGYTDFVATTSTQLNTAGTALTVALPVDRSGNALCTAPAANTITCAGFQSGTAAYSFVRGSTTMTWTPKS